MEFHHQQPLDVWGVALVVGRIDRRVLVIAGREECTGNRFSGSQLHRGLLARQVIDRHDDVAHDHIRLEEAVGVRLAHQLPERLIYARIARVERRQGLRGARCGDQVLFPQASGPVRVPPPAHVRSWARGWRAMVEKNSTAAQATMTSPTTHQIGFFKLLPG